MKYFALLGVTVSALSFGALASTNETTQAQVVDTQGKPPFKRKLVDVPVADVAQFEEANTVKTVKKRVVVSYQGKPPYTRRTIEVPVADVAQFEASDAPGEGSAKKGARPPFKR